MRDWSGRLGWRHSTGGLEGVPGGGRQKLKETWRKVCKGVGLYQILRALARWGWKSDRYWLSKWFWSNCGAKLNVTPCQKERNWVVQSWGVGQWLEEDGGSFLLFPIVGKCTECEGHHFRRAGHWRWAQPTVVRPAPPLSSRTHPPEPGSVPILPATGSTVAPGHHQPTFCLSVSPRCLRQGATIQCLSFVSRLFHSA